MEEKINGLEYEVKFKNNNSVQYGPDIKTLYPYQNKRDKFKGYIQYKTCPLCGDVTVERYKTEDDSKTAFCSFSCFRDFAEENNVSKICKWE